MHFYNIDFIFLCVIMYIYMYILVYIYIYIYIYWCIIDMLVIIKKLDVDLLMYELLCTDTIYSMYVEAKDSSLFFFFLFFWSF